MTRAAYHQPNDWRWLRDTPSKSAGRLPLVRGLRRLGIASFTSVFHDILPRGHISQRGSQRSATNLGYAVGKQWLMNIGLRFSEWTFSAFSAVFPIGSSYTLRYQVLNYIGNIRYEIFHTVIILV